MKEYEGVMHGLAAKSLRGVFGDEYDHLDVLDPDGSKLIRQDFLEANEKEGLDVREYHRRIGPNSLESYARCMKARFLKGWDANLRYNNQEPPVSMKDITDGGCAVWNDTEVYNAQGKYVGMFEDVEWGHGASGLLMINHVPITDHPVRGVNL
jgi:hypothetical protein